eukprot:TRINITY_DN2874_c0_g1_i8.p1 TRINITY_DN2874_c0_g1~~TRINITY_DN2874_c0_g1_i8.p1  ORF type:complete len:107 (-),score=13.31 TRINITY_DN2874_c0_g1_i8:179-499(-)
MKQNKRQDNQKEIFLQPGITVILEYNQQIDFIRGKKKGKCFSSRGTMIEWGTMILRWGQHHSRQQRSNDTTLRRAIEDCNCSEVGSNGRGMEYFQNETVSKRLIES